jgi:hypothetical protein
VDKRGVYNASFFGSSLLDFFSTKNCKMTTTGERRVKNLQRSQSILPDDNVSDSQCVRAAEEVEMILQEEADMLFELSTIIPASFLDELTQPPISQSALQTWPQTFSEAPTLLLASNKPAGSTNLGSIAQSLNIPHTQEAPAGRQRMTATMYDMDFPQKKPAAASEFCSPDNSLLVKTEVPNAPLRKNRRGNQFYGNGQTQYDTFSLEKLQQTYLDRFDPHSQKHLDDRDYMVKRLIREDHYPKDAVSDKKAAVGSDHNCCLYHTIMS